MKHAFCAIFIFQTRSREVLRKVVPTFKRPEEVNKEVGAEVEPEDNSLPQRRVRA